MEPVGICVGDAGIPSNSDDLVAIWYNPDSSLGKRPGCRSSWSSWPLDLYPLLEDDLVMVVLELCEENNPDLVIGRNEPPSHIVPQLFQRL